MDEPTASLDSKTESKILDTIIKLKNIDIKIIVTHNNTLANMCDRHITLEDGKILV